MKLLFIDHAAHQRTLSTRFFVSELQKYGDVQVFYFDPSTPADSIASLQQQVTWRDFDLIVVWQLEALALLSLASGAPTLICPMYDASGGMPIEHWALYERAALLNFSLSLQVVTREIVPLQKLVKYYPDPTAFGQVADFSQLHAFFWERRPSELPTSLVATLLPSDVVGFHVHQAPDFNAPSETASLSIPMQTSTWLESRTGFASLLEKFNVFICPRFNEGIGMSMLEAMARGMCVIAHNEPTHNEYIAHNVNGLLFNHSTEAPLDLSSAAQFGARARSTVERGHLRWRRQVEELPAFFDAVAAARPVPTYDIDTASALAIEYFSAPESYLDRARMLYSKSRHAASAGWPNVVANAKVERVRRLAGQIPGWSILKGLAPLSMKRVVARILGKLIPSGD